MKLVVGLGNLGEKFEGTRHNMGFLVLDELKTEISKSKFLNSKQAPNSKFQKKKNLHSEIIRINDLILAKPTTFMNSSGIAVSSLATFFKIQTSDVYVIHDDLDISLGEYKIQLAKGPKDHNGIRSIEEKLCSDNFWRVRVGIDNDESRITNHESRIDGEDYVLMKFSEEEVDTLEAVIEEVVEDLNTRLVH